MSNAISQRHRRTYFNNPLVEESLQHLPAAIHHPTSVGFRAYLVENLHHSSEQTRQRFAQYISQRFSLDGQMNLDLARALAKYGDSRTGREILYFELLQAAPVLHDVASLWLAEQPSAGVPRSNLLSFLEPRLEGRNAGQVATAVVTVFRRCRKLTSPKPAIYIPVWAEPSLEAFLYVLARLFPERTMVRFDLFAGQPIMRALLWPRPALTDLVDRARLAGHVSKVSQLDQYHQFTLAEDGTTRLQWLTGEQRLLPSTVQEPETSYGITKAGNGSAFPPKKPSHKVSRGTSAKKKPANTQQKIISKKSKIKKLAQQLPLLPNHE